jgi:hypothetical protein
VKRRFPEDCSAEQVMHQYYDRWSVPSWSVKRNLVEVFDEYIVSVSGQPFLEISPGIELERVSRSCPVNVDAIDECARRAAGPSAGEKIDAMSHRRDPPKDFMEMYFGASAVRILSIVPVDDEYPH